MDNYEVARVFRSIADMLEIKGENRFRINAYRRAARAVEEIPEPVAGRVREDSLREIPGIGKDLAAKITELVQTGGLAYYEELKAEIPPGLVSLLQIPGIGPSTARTLFEQGGVAGIDQLEAAAREGRLRMLPGIRKKTEANILRGIEIFRSGMARRPRGMIMPEVRHLESVMKRDASLVRLSPAGSIRRGRDTVKDIDLVGVSADPEQTMERFTTLSEVAEVLAAGATRASVRLHSGLQVDLRLVDDASYGAALGYFTGSKEHNIRLRELAVKKGLKLNEYGLFRDRERLAGATEEEIFRALGLPFIPPELREDRGEIEAALENTLPRLVTAEDLRGDLHVHSIFSDGHDDLETIAREARRRGLEWVAVCDHSQSLRIANGLTVDRLMEKHRLIREFNDRSPDVKLLSGTEVDILREGGLDYPDEVLARLDIVVAAVHTAFRLPKAEMTARIIRAMQNPRVHIIAHPTGRLLGERDPYELDMQAVIQEAARTRTALEINGYPKRLDLNDLHARAAIEAGVRLSLGSDAHRAAQLEFLFLGLTTARRAWAEKTHVLNALSYEELTLYLKGSNMHSDRPQ